MVMNVSLIKKRSLVQIQIRPPLNRRLAQLVRASRLHREGQQFKSVIAYQYICWLAYRLCSCFIRNLKLVQLQYQQPFKLLNIIFNKILLLVKFC